MPKDNETIHLPLDGPITPSEPQAFAADEMIRCDECLRANPPTRISCLYCETPLPLTEASARLRKPTLRQPEKHQLGFNCILNADHRSVQSDQVAKAAELLKLSNEDLQRIIDLSSPLPVARTVNLDEAELVVERLGALGFRTLVLSDRELGIREAYLVRPRSLHFDEECLFIHQPGGKNEVSVEWSELCLMVSGRLIVKRMEVTELLTRRSEREIMDASQFFSDEAVFDLYSSVHEQTWRIGTNGFDFSCLQNGKSFVANENLEKLRQLISSKCERLLIDAAYNELKTVLEPVWPVEQESYSRGWRRELPGKYSLGAATVNNNESQFTRYSRLRRYFAIALS